MLKTRLAQVLVAVMVAIAAPAAVAAPAHAASCPTDATDADGRAVPGGWLICGTNDAWAWYDGRRHYFVVGTDNAIWHTWQTCKGNCGYAAWSSLGGSAQNFINWGTYTQAGRAALEIVMRASNGSLMCKNYNGTYTGAWWPSTTGWTSNGADCLIF
ncbi:hypothetical protein F4553_000290 [Allocatelliglobosispora scoriae]|uniref:PLL-like beta propeller domain-containing protein n=1 Tax=Allocatelliglobosispora scoriae TaxID=643052 RepID=A0A841BJ34_9ACTN|nr:hypothetical protein [Allocatelliglobosispora scoriae]MBB5866911.1 hypothetical protein [Allocatelliglobosispora scoriae]